MSFFFCLFEILCFVLNEAKWLGDDDDDEETKKRENKK